MTGNETQTPTPHAIPIGSSSARLDAFEMLRLVSEVGLDRRPSIVLIGVGTVAFILVLAAKLRVLGLDVGELQLMEFVSALVAAGYFVLVGAVLHLSADRVEDHRATAVTGALRDVLRSPRGSTTGTSDGSPGATE